jgi:hypothetical protein
VDHASDYVKLVEAIFEHFGWSRPSVSCVEEGGRRRLCIQRGEIAAEAELEGDTDWVDIQPLCALLNDALAGQAALVPMPTRDQSFALASLTPEKARLLRSLDELDEWHTP